MDFKEIKVLYVHDEVHNLKAFKATFRRDFKVFIAESGKEALKILYTEDLNIILTDQRMREMTGIELLVEIQKINPEPMRIRRTGYSDIYAVIDVINKGQVYCYLNKPWQEEELKLTIQMAFELFALRRENKEL